MKKSSTIGLLAATVLLMAAMSSYAAAPRKINYQGYLTNPAGAPLTGTYPMLFSLCDAAAAGTCPWTETQSVSIDKGIFNVSLGAVTPLSLSFDIPYFLDIQVNGEQMSARQPLTSVGYAFSADRAESVANGSITNASISGAASIEAAKISGLGALATKDAVTSDDITNNTITNSDLAAGSFGNITGVGVLDTLTVNGNTLLSQTSGSKVGIGSNATSPRAELEIGGTDGLLVRGTINSGTVRALGAGLRMHWYPRKGAFRVGNAETSYWDDDGTSYPKLALYSIAMGYQPRATAVASTAIGAYNQATGDYSLSLGSYSHATASHSVAIGTQAYATGIYSIAIGTGANTNGYDGAMVIGDDSYFQTAYANSDNQLTMRFAGGIGNSSTQDACGTGSASYRFWTYYPDCTAGVYMTSHGSGWSNYSSRKFKENFRELDGEELLGKIRNMSITEWNYKGRPDDKYIGPVAEEFKEAFKLNGDDEAGINTISIDGVNMAGVQALEKRTSAMKGEMAEMKATIELLKAEIAALKAQAAGK